MILNFPLEIIHIISSHLKFKDKLKLKTACRKLNEVITKAVLYEKLDLSDLQYRNKYEHYGSPSKAGDSIIQKLINNGFDGSLVKELQLDINKLSGPILSQISDVFPNIQRVITISKKKGSPSNQYRHGRIWQNTSVPLLKWRNIINKIVSLYDWDELKWDVFFSKYPRLTELDLVNLFSMLNPSDTDKKVTFFSNAPLLTTLTLRFGVFNLKILEAIHTGFPLLVTLKLFDLVMKEEMDNSLPSSIVPANKLTYLGLFQTKNVNTNDEVMYYITKKYPNLQHLVFSVRRDADYSIKTRDDFKVTRLNIEKDSEKFIFNQMAISKEHFLKYNSIESVFFSNLPKSLKTLTLDIINLNNVLEALAKSDVNIRVLNLVNNNCIFPRIWKDTNILNHFRNLTSLTTLKIMLDSSVQTFALECVSFSITKLYINLCGHSFSIEWVFSVFPLFEELYINPSRSGNKESDIKGYHGGNDRVTEEILPRRQYQNLRILNMKSCFVYSDFFDFMKMAVPNLFELDLTIRFSSSSSSSSLSSLSLMSLHYDLSNWNLNKCHLEFVPYPGVPYVYCTITIQNVSKWFVIDYVKKCLLPCNQDFRQETSRIWLEMKLDHINQLTIAGILVV